MQRVASPHPRFQFRALRHALNALDALELNGIEKGLPDRKIRLGDIGRQRWNILRGDVPLPVMVLKWADVKHNIALLQAFCDQHGAWLAPHGKTMMAPQLWAEQLRAGAWAITVANVAQLQVCRAFGLRRVLVANEMVSAYDVRYLGQVLNQDPDLELYVLVDSAEGVERLVQGLASEKARRPLAVLIEFGMTGGRCGVRDAAALRALAEKVISAQPLLRLAGVEGYEGIAPGATLTEREAAADSYLNQLADAVRAVRTLVAEDELFLVSAGGSVYFDRVVAILGRQALPEVQLVLRSGGYVTHDSSFYDKSSPMGSMSQRNRGIGVLRPALRVWSAVLSRPEPTLTILSMGGRDMPTDIEQPVPLLRSRNGETPEPIGEGYQVLKNNDQHAYLRVPLTSDLRVGDLVGCGISHPCTAFDKWRLLLVVDDEHNVTGAVRTFF